MRKLIFCLLLSNGLKAQHHVKVIDSLAKATKLNVVGYSISYMKDRETMIIFYYEKGEMEDKILYTKKL